ncbi:MAG: hypothetical protein Kow0042_28980 [Calditrichia bacterium]
MPHEILIVGAGPAGSSAAIQLARAGREVLLLDKASFPREKVCGDGLTPQALYWLDQLGCIEEVLDRVNCCISECDLYIDGEHILTGEFPQNTPYPHFCTLLDRKTLDSLLVEKAVSCGVKFIPNARVKSLRYEKDCIVAEVVEGGKSKAYGARLLIGADGANSLVSRFLGNGKRDGACAVSVRCYFEGVKINGAQIKIFFNREFFPGYGWIFTDDSGRANCGVGYAYDQNFPLPYDIKEMFAAFVQRDLQPYMKSARQVGRLAGWWSAFFEPRHRVGERILLVGDAANSADPMNGGGIHKAMESAWYAAHIAEKAVAAGDYSKEFLSEYESVWAENSELDWRTAELFLTFAKNPQLKEFYLLLLKAIGKLTQTDQSFRNFCSGVFAGMQPQHDSICPKALWNAFPHKPGAWLQMLFSSNGNGSAVAGELAHFMFKDALKIGSRLVSNPLSNLNWGLEILNKANRLLNCYLRDHRSPAGVPTESI